MRNPESLRGAGHLRRRRFGSLLLVIASLLAIVAVRYFVAAERQAALDGGPPPSIRSSPRAAVTPQESLRALLENKLPTRLVRMVLFDPQTDPQLSIGRLTMLGRPDHKFIFVGDYDELRGATVAHAVYRLGGSLRPGQHVSAIIFPVQERPLFPASARGVLQVIRELDREMPAGSPDSATTDLAKHLSSAAIAALDNADDPGGRWENYQQFYNDYAQTVEALRAEPAPVLKLIGTIDRDWHPLGYSQALGRLDPPAPGFTIELAGKPLEVPHFGARVFLVANTALADLTGQCLIDFHDPQSQRIPELDSAPNDE